MKRIIDHGDIIEIISGGPDEWAASNAIIAEAKARWQAQAAAKNGEAEVAQPDEATQDQTAPGKVGGKDENKIFDAMTAHHKALAEGATPETAPALPEMRRVEFQRNSAALGDSDAH